MKSSNAISIKNPVGKVVGHVKRLMTMTSSLAELIGDKSRVDAVYDESIDALRDWEEKERERLDKLEEAVRNRCESIEVDSHEVGEHQISGLMDNEYCSSDAKRLIDEVNLALKAHFETIGKTPTVIEPNKCTSAAMPR